MMLFKACPRCHGDLVLGPEVYDEPAVLTCFQCGRTVALTAVPHHAHRAAALLLSAVPKRRIATASTPPDLPPTDPAAR